MNLFPNWTFAEFEKGNKGFISKKPFKLDSMSQHLDHVLLRFPLNKYINVTTKNVVTVNRNKVTLLMLLQLLLILI